MENETTFNNFLSGGNLIHGSLFSGIGGFELGAEWAGIPTKWNCEFETYQRKILKQHFPNTKQYDDIRTMQNPESVDIISGGFPCQDISTAGKGTGIKGSRSGLWSEMFRIIREVRPKYIIAENSPALTIRGFEQVLCDLSEIGYNAEWQCLSAETFGLHHKRQRIYVIAYPNQNGCNDNPTGFRVFQEVFCERTPNPFIESLPVKRIDGGTDFDSLRINDDFTNRLDKRRIECVGNSVVPLISYYLFSCIKRREKKLLKVETKSSI